MTAAQTFTEKFAHLISPGTTTRLSNLKYVQTRVKERYVPHSLLGISEDGAKEWRRIDELLESQLNCKSDAKWWDAVFAWERERIAQILDLARRQNGETSP